MATRSARASRETAYGTTPAERAKMARVLAFLFASGAALVAGTLLLPHDDGTDVVGVAAAVVAAAIVGAALAIGGPRVSPRAIHVALAGGTALITQCVVFGGSSAGAYAIMYVWVALYACYFFGPAQATAHVVLSAALYGGVLAVDGPGDDAVPHVDWMMSVGSIAVGALLVGRLTRAVRAQARDLAAVAEMANGLSEISPFGRATCEGLRDAAGADLVVLLEPGDGDDEMEVSAMSGTPEAGHVFDGERARLALAQAYVDSRATPILADDAPSGLHRFRGSVLGLAQPVLRGGEAAGVLAVAWTRRRRSLPERVCTAALLFAAQASVGVERAERESRDRERAALEINDNIVQGLVVAKYLLTSGRVDESVSALEETLGRARRLITDQLDEVSRAGGRIEPGDLARKKASPVGEAEPRPVRS